MPICRYQEATGAAPSPHTGPQPLSPPSTPCLRPSGWTLDWQLQRQPPPVPRRLQLIAYVCVYMRTLHTHTHTRARTAPRVPGSGGRHTAKISAWGTKERWIQHLVQPGLRLGGQRVKEAGEGWMALGWQPMDGAGRMEGTAALCPASFPLLPDQCQARGGGKEGWHWEAGKRGGVRSALAGPCSFGCRFSILPSVSLLSPPPFSLSPSSIAKCKEENRPSSRPPNLSQTPLSSPQLTTPHHHQPSAFSSRVRSPSFTGLRPHTPTGAMFSKNRHMGVFFFKAT